MKNYIRTMFAAALALFVTAALPFSDGFEANAAPLCDYASTLDLNDGLSPVLLKANSKVCVDAGAATAFCERDPLGVCKRKSAPIPPQPGIPACSFPGIAGHPYVQPLGFIGTVVPWEQLMLGAKFPFGNSFLSPTGAYTLRAQNPPKMGPPMFGRYIATPFIAQQGGAYVISWVGVQRQSEVPGYTVARNAKSAFVSISPCAGDLRPSDRFSADPWLTNCRASLASGSLKFGTGSTCKLQAGQTYYLNYALVEPSDGLTTTETTCGYRPAEGRCEVNLQGK